MYSYPEIRTIHLELTERCNAACPQCPRRIDGGVINPQLTMAELSLAEIRQLLPEQLIAQLKKIYLCGNYGDAAAASETLEIIRYFRGVSATLKIGLHTNGSLRPITWWGDLAHTLGAAGYVRFAIDGLQDTNPIYRRNTDWQKIMANVQAFIAAGGHAEWDFIVFAHNEHQVDAAEALSKELGFSAFYVKKTARFLERDGMAYAVQTPVRDRSGAMAPVLERPNSAAYQSEFLHEVSSKREFYDSFNDFLDNREIHCKVQQEKSLYISAEGKILPCCWLGQMLKNPPSDETRDAVGRFGAIFRDTTLDGKTQSIDTIVADSFFQKDLPAAWRGKGKLRVCARVCGQ